MCTFYQSIWLLKVFTSFCTFINSPYLISNDHQKVLMSKYLIWKVRRLRTLSNLSQSESWYFSIHCTGSVTTGSHVTKSHQILFILMLKVREGQSVLWSLCGVYWLSFLSVERRWCLSSWLSKLTRQFGRWNRSMWGQRINYIQSAKMFTSEHW